MYGYRLSYQEEIKEDAAKAATQYGEAAKYAQMAYAGLSPMTQQQWLDPATGSFLRCEGEFAEVAVAYALVHSSIDFRHGALSRSIYYIGPHKSYRPSFERWLPVVQDSARPAGGLRSSGTY